MLGFAIRGLVVVASALAAGAALALGSRLVGALAVAAWLSLAFLGFVWLPRAAHRAFVRGSYKRSKLLYKLLRLAVFGRTARAAIDVSLAACDLTVENWSTALVELDRIAADTLGEGARAAWLNNRAYAMARSGDGIDSALGLCDEAIAIRPDVAGFRHTRGVILLALDRVDEAIAELDRLWEDLAGERADEVPLLEAERCYDLAIAWARKGEHDYATDYFQRAQRASPDSRWAMRASDHVDPAAARAAAELLGA